MPGKAKHPVPKEQQQETAQLKQRVAVLEARLSSLLKDLEKRKQFFSGIEP